MKKSSLGKLFLYLIGAVLAVALAIILMPVAALAGAIGTWYFSKRKVDPKKKNLSLGLLVVGLLGSIFLTPMAFKEGKNQATVPSLSSSSTSEASSSSSTKKATEDSSVKTETSESKSSTSEPVKVQEVNFKEVIDKMNEDTIKVGEQYKFTVVLRDEDLWGKDDLGYQVMVAPKEDLDLLGQVYVDEKSVEQWTDGTEVKFTVEVFEGERKAADNKPFKVKELKAVSTEILSGGTTKEAKEEAKKAAEKAKLAEYFTALQTAKDTMNAESGMEVITSIDPGYADHAYHVNLSIVFLQVSKPEAKVLINKLNETLVSLADQQGLSAPQFSYYVEGTEVGENRIIMNPYEVKFKKILD